MTVDSLWDTSSVEGSDGDSVRHLVRMTSSRPSLDPQVESRGGELLGARRGVAERKLVRKLDMRLLPTVVMISIMNSIDVCFSQFLIMRLQD